MKKLCFEYQVDEKEVKELLARMEMVYLDKGETIASATMPEQSLYIIVSGILHTYTTHEGEDRTIRFLSEGDAVLCYNSSQYAVKALTKCAAYYISEEVTGKAVVLNLEGIHVEIAQRIIDYSAGSTYAIRGNLQKITNYIFLVTPPNVDISGDIPEIVTGGIDLSSFNKNENRF